jgi:predicted nucleotidyltransferase component of viral defense system
MKLHEDERALEEAIRATALHLSLPITYVEKDYWVTRALKELALSNVCEKIVFKGGTSLSKAYGLIARFSEDIDIAVLTEGLTKNQARKRVKKACKVISDIFTEIDSPDTSKNSHFRKVRFVYPRIDNSVVEGQVTDSLLLEVNAFAAPEPYNKMPISSYIADFLNESNQGDSVSQFELEPFEINVLCTSRTVSEKLMGLVKASYGADHIDNLRRKIRHIYDVYFLLTDKFTNDFVKSKDFQEMIGKVIASDQTTFSPTPWFDQPLMEASLFSEFDTVWPQLESTYNGDFKAMVVDKNLPSGDMIKEVLEPVFQQLKAYDDCQRCQN